MNDRHSSYKQKCPKKKKNTGEYSPLDFRAAYVTAEVYDLLMPVAYWACLPDHQPQARVMPCPILC